MEDKRKVQNIFVLPGIQARLFAPFLTMLVVAVVLINGILFVVFSALYRAFPDLTPEQGEALSQMLYNSVITSAIGLALMAFLGFALTIIISHRLLGPLVSIKRHMQSLIEGRYEGRLRLRKNDELHFLADQINSLADRLKEQGKL